MHTQEEKKNLATVKGFLDLYPRDSVAAFERYCAPTVTWVDLPNQVSPAGVVSHSIDELRKVIAGRDQVVSQVEGETIRMVADGDDVVAHSVLTYRLKDGGAWDFDLAGWFTLRDGLITAATAFASLRP